MVTRQSLQEELAWMIDQLSKPLPPHELEAGWTEQGRVAMLKFFEDLDSKLGNGEKLPEVNIPRGMDSWGIVEGQLLKKAAELSLDLKKFSSGT
jgi:hypothetical protein